MRRPFRTGGAVAMAALVLLTLWAVSGLPGDAGGASDPPRGPVVAPPPSGSGPPGAAGDVPSRPRRVGSVTAADLAGVFRAAGEIEPLTSLLVSHRGELLGERYFHGFSRSRVFNVKSVSKTVLSALVGVAIGEGRLEGVDQPLAELLPDYYASIDDPRKRDITVGDLLSMRAGLETTSFGNYGAWVAGSDWVRGALRKPVICEPGSCWEYSTGNYHLLSAALTRATGVSTRSYAARELLGPLGIPARPWDRGPDGFYLGGNNMAFTPPELLRFGEMYLDGGRWNGRQVVPETWVEASWRPRITSPWNGHRYGYGWWMRRVAGEPVRFAWGYGGQYLFVLPGLDLAVVATADPRLERGRRDADRAIFRLLRGEIIPAVRDK